MNKTGNEMHKNAKKVVDIYEKSGMITTESNFNVPSGRKEEEMVKVDDVLYDVDKTI